MREGMSLEELDSQIQQFVTTHVKSQTIEAKFMECTKSKNVQSFKDHLNCAKDKHTLSMQQLTEESIRQR
jgi:helix-turn-helix protein